MEYWAKTKITDEGNLLHARTYLVSGGEPTVMNLTVDLEPIRQAMQDRAQVAGFFGDAWDTLESGVKKVGRNKLVKKVARGTKAVVRSKITGAVAAGAAYAYPPVGAPALAAYATANIVLDDIERGEKAAKQLKREVKGLGLAAKKKAIRKAKGLSKRAKAKAIKQLNMSAGKLKAAVAKHKANKAKLRKLNGMLSNPKVPAQVKLIMGEEKRNVQRQMRQFNDLMRKLEAKKAKRLTKLSQLTKKKGSPANKLLKKVRLGVKRKQELRRLVKKARLGQLAAKKATRVFGIVATSRARSKIARRNLRGGVRGLVIDNSGGLHRGQFKQLSLKKGLLPHLMLTKGGKVRQGHFQVMK